MIPPAESTGSPMNAAGDPTAAGRQVEPGVEAGEVARAVAVAHRTAVGVRRRNREGAGHQRAEAAPRTEVDRGAAGELAVEAPRQPTTSKPPVCIFASLSANSVDSAPGLERDTRASAPGTSPTRRWPARAPAPTASGVRWTTLRALPDRVDDPRMVVPERRADLAGGEVEHPPAVPVSSQTPSAAGHDGREAAPVADQILLPLVDRPEWALRRYLSPVAHPPSKRAFGRNRDGWLGPGRIRGTWEAILSAASFRDLRGSDVPSARGLTVSAARRGPTPKGAAPRAAFGPA